MQLIWVKKMSNHLPTPCSNRIRKCTFIFNGSACFIWFLFFYGLSTLTFVPFRLRVESDLDNYQRIGYHYSRELLTRPAAIVRIRITPDNCEPCKRENTKTNSHRGFSLSFVTPIPSVSCFSYVRNAASYPRGAHTGESLLSVFILPCLTLLTVYLVKNQKPVTRGFALVSFSRGLLGLSLRTAMRLGRRALNFIPFFRRLSARFTANLTSSTVLLFHHLNVQSMVISCCTRVIRNNDTSGNLLL